MKKKKCKIVFEQIGEQSPVAVKVYIDGFNTIEVLTLIKLLKKNILNGNVNFAPQETQEP